MLETNCEFSELENQLFITYFVFFLLLDYFLFYKFNIFDTCNKFLQFEIPQSTTNYLLNMLIARVFINMQIIYINKCLCVNLNI